MERKCGDCRECCIVLTVEPLNKPPDTPCHFLNRTGCGIYSKRPNCCREFTCAWKEGALPLRMQPNRVHAVVWATKMLSPTGEEMPVIQCDVRRGYKKDRRLIRKLKQWSITIPVLVVQSDIGELYDQNRKVIEWYHHKDFIALDRDQFGKLTAEVVPRELVLCNPDQREAWEQHQRRCVEVTEDDPKYMGGKR